MNAQCECRCGCGYDAPSAHELFGCFECGTTCCRACAGSLLDSTAVHAAAPFELH